MSTCVKSVSGGAAKWYQNFLASLDRTHWIASYFWPQVGLLKQKTVKKHYKKYGNFCCLQNKQNKFYRFRKSLFVIKKTRERKFWKLQSLENLKLNFRMSREVTQNFVDEKHVFLFFQLQQQIWGFSLGRRKVKKKVEKNRGFLHIFLSKSNIDWAIKSVTVIQKTRDEKFWPYGHLQFWKITFMSSGKVSQNFVKEQTFFKCFCFVATFFWKVRLNFQVEK